MYHEATDLKWFCEFIKAACYFRLKEYARAKVECDEVLKEEINNVKALYRRAAAQFGLEGSQECIWYCKCALGIDPRSKDARCLLDEAHTGQME